MNPELRNWYLSNLGIVQYVPKGQEPVTLQFHSDPVVGDAESEPGPESGQSHLAAGGKASLVEASSVKAQVANVLGLMDVKTVDARTAEEKEPLPLNNTEGTLTSVNPAVSLPVGIPVTIYWFLTSSTLVRSLIVRNASYLATSCGL